MTTLDMNYITEVAQRAKEGDANAFAELYAATCDRQYSFACEQLGDTLRAQEVLQQVYINALKDISKLREPSLAVTWLNRVNLWQCVKAKGKTLNGSLTLKGKSYTVAQVLALPLSEGQTILLRYLQGMRTGRIAACLEITPRDVRGHIRAGIDRLTAGEGGRR